MSLSVNANTTETFQAGSSDSFRSLNHTTNERSAPLPIRSRGLSTSQGTSPFIPGISHTSGSSCGSNPRRLQREPGGSFHEVRRDHRSYSAEWISSPLLEGFASFHSALNSVQEVASALESPTSPSSALEDDMSCSLPYLGTCWSHDHSGESSVGSSRSTQSSLASTDTTTNSSAESSSLVIEDWELLKSRSLSTDWDFLRSRSLSAEVVSPVPMENFMPFLFPIDQDQGGTQSSPAQRMVFTPEEHNQHHVRQQHHDLTPSYPDTSVAAPAASHYAQAPAPHMQVQHNAWMPVLGSHPPTSTIQTDGARFATPLESGNPIAMLSRPYQAQAFPSQHYHTQAPSPPAVPYPPVDNHSQPLGSWSRQPPVVSPTLPPADIQLITKLNQCYWKNGRKNLQCFPICPEHNDFYSMKMSNRKHTSVGVCRGPVYCHVFLPAAVPSPDGTMPKPSRTTGQHMKYEFGVGASGTGGSAFEVFVLGKFERVPQRNENEDLAELLPPADHFETSSDFETFRYSCFQAVEMEERRMATQSPQDLSGVPDHIVRSTWFFLPDVWKVQPMLKKKRKATRSAPAQAFPFCFRVFVYIRDPASEVALGGEPSPNASYRCIASAASSFFELYSTRTVDRVKRKYWSRTDGEGERAGGAMVASMATTPSSTHVAKRASRG